MAGPLEVDPDGLRIASAIVSEHAADVALVADFAPGDNAASSSVGAASLAASIETFRAAYASRLAGHSKSAVVAAGSYTKTDEGRASDIATVSV